MCKEHDTSTKWAITYLTHSQATHTKKITRKIYQGTNTENLNKWFVWKINRRNSSTQQELAQNNYCAQTEHYPLPKLVCITGTLAADDATKESIQSLCECESLDHRRQTKVSPGEYDKHPTKDLYRMVDGEGHSSKFTTRQCRAPNFVLPMVFTTDPYLYVFGSFVIWSNYLSSTRIVHLHNIRNW